MTRLAGGCLCGGVRYAIEVEQDDVADYCHCRECRRASGAPVVAWVQVSLARFQVTAGQARSFASSTAAARWFCGSCGSQLYMTDHASRSVGVPIASLDEPDQVRPRLHGWYEERIPWFDTKDELLRFPRHPPYDR